MIIALQFNPSIFLTNLRNDLRLRIQLPGFPVTFQNQTWYVDGIVVEKNTTIATGTPDPQNTRGVPVIDNQNKKTPTANLDAVILIDQPVTARLYTFADLANAANQGQDPGPTTNITFDLGIELAIDLSGAAPALLLSLSSVKLLGVDVPELQQLVAPFFPPTSVPLDLASLSTFLKDVGLIDITRGGLAVSTAGLPTLALELQNPSVGPTPSPLWDWTAFNMPGPSTDLVLGSAFGILLDGRIVADLLAGFANDGLNQQVLEGQLKLSTSPSGSWIGDRAVVTFSGDKVDACTFLFLSHDLSFDATVNLIPQVPKENTLRLDITADFSTSAWDDFVCAFSSATFPMNVVNLLQQGQLSSGAAAAISLAHFFGGLEGFLNIFNGTLVAIGNFDPLGDQKKNNPQVQVPPSTTHDSEVFLDQDLQLPVLPAGTPFLETVAGSPIGPILQGKLAPPATDLTTFPLSLYILPVAWANLTACTLDPTVKAEIDPNCDVIHAQVIDDPLNQFSPFLAVEEFSVTITIPQASVLPAYLASPYPCKILIFTSLGVRLINLGTFPPISENIVQGLKASIAADPHCLGFGSSQLGSGKWVIDWLGDPSPDPYLVQLWTLGISSLAADNVLTVLGGSGITLGVANTFNNQGQLSLLNSSPGSPTAHVRAGLTLQRRGSPMLLRPNQRAIRVTQTSLTRRAEMVLDDVCISLDIAQERDVPLVLGVDRAGLNVWSLLSRSWPQLRYQLARPGLAGALMRDGRYVVWGQDGIFALPAPDPRWSSSIQRGPVDNYLRVIPNGPGFIALSPTKLVRLDPQLHPTAELPVTAAFDLAPAGRFAIIAARTGISQVDLSVPTLSVSHTITRAVAALGRARVSGHSSAFYARGIDGTHSILEFDSQGQLQTLNTYTEEPWFAASLTLGNTMVRLSPFRSILSVYLARRVLRYQT